MGKIIEVSNLNVSAGGKNILNDLSLDIFENRVNTIVGPSGGGKSTLLRCLNRLTDLNPVYKVSGRVMFQGKDLRSIDEVKLRREIGLVFQKPNPFPMSIYDNVAFGLRIQATIKRNVMDQMVHDALEEVGLYAEVKENLKRSANTLSGGQQQRLCIARALVLKPKVLMMDEPTSSLDPVAKGRINDLIVSLSEKYTVILVTHDISQSRRVSNYTSLIYNGKIVATAEGENLFDVESEEVRAFLGESAQ